MERDGINSVSNDYVSPTIICREENIIFQDSPYILYWTPHAACRANSRNENGQVVLNIFLKDALHYLPKINKSGYLTIRDYASESMFVLHFDCMNRYIHVITYADIYSMYPREGERVVQRNSNNSVKDFVWYRN